MLDPADKDELISDICLWAPLHNVGQQEKNNIPQLCIDIRYHLDNLSRAMANNERFKGICALSTP